jgi:hypothetical protein
VKSGWYRVDQSNLFRYWDEDSSDFQGEAKKFGVSQKVTFLIGPKSFPRAKSVRILFVIAGFIVLNIAVLGISLLSDEMSTNIDGISRIVVLSLMMYLSTKVGYRWFDGLLSAVPFYGVFYIGRTLWRASVLPHRYWKIREDDKPGEHKTDSAPSVPVSNPDIPTLRDVRAEERAYAGVSSTGESTDNSNLIPTSSKLKDYGSLILLVVLVILCVNLYSQYQLRNLLDSANAAQSRLNTYATSFNMSKPLKDSNGNLVYNGYYGEAAWENFLSNRLNALASGTATELYVLINELEQTRVFGIFRESSESKERLVDYYNDFYKYLILTQGCRTNACYNIAVNSLSEIEGKRLVIKSTLDKAKPRIDVFSVEDKIRKIVGT